MHLNEAPTPGRRRFVQRQKTGFHRESLPAEQGSGLGLGRLLLHNLSHLQVFKSSIKSPSLPAGQSWGVVWVGWRRFCCTLSAIFKSSSVLLGNIGGFPHHDITLMATLTIKQQLESKRLYLFVTNSSVEITLATSSILVKMGDTQSKSADKNEGE